MFESGKIDNDSLISKFEDDYNFVKENFDYLSLSDDDSLFGKEKINKDLLLD